MGSKQLRALSICFGADSSPGCERRFIGEQRGHRASTHDATGY